jgi:HlyD family secretion protein
MEEMNKTSKPPVLSLLELARRARHAESGVALQFILVNQTHEIAPYLIAALWVEGEGIVMQSGVTEVEKHAPFIMWLSQLGDYLSETQNKITQIEPSMLSTKDVDAWESNLPPEALWLPILTHQKKAGLLICREIPWADQEIKLLNEWMDTWAHAWNKMHVQSLPGEMHQIGQSLKAWMTLSDGRNDEGFVSSLWSNKRRRFFIFIFLMLLIPVRLSVLAPAEIVSSKPAIIRVPIEGVVDEFFVKPNQKVVEGQPLLKLDLTSLKSRLQIAQQETQVASTEYRQSTLQSLTDAKSRTQLASQEGKASEKKLETEYVKDLLEKAQIKSPRDGVAIFDDPSEWIGKPVAAGERVMIVANESDVEIEAWLSVNNAIELPRDAKVTFYLNTSPLSPIEGIVKSIGYEAMQRPDSTYAYRLRADVTSKNLNQRIGLKGTAKISGHYVPLAYWVFRKPLAMARQFLGL